MEALFIMFRDVIVAFALSWAGVSVSAERDAQATLERPRAEEQSTKPAHGAGCGGPASACASSMPAFSADCAL